MSTNIACSVPKCNNPVIGQCTGYKKDCRRYYCHEHSNGTLCADCASRKIYDEEAESIYNEYLSLAEKVSKESTLLPTPLFTIQEFLANKNHNIIFGAISFVIGIFLFIVFILAIIKSGNLYTASIEDFSIPLGFLGFSLFVFFLEWTSHKSKLIEYQKEKKIIELVSAIENEKKGFTEFWKAWVVQQKEEKAEKSKQALMGVLAVVGAIAVGAIASSLNESEYDRTRRAVRDELNQK